MDSVRRMCALLALAALVPAAPAAAATSLFIVNDQNDAVDAVKGNNTCATSAGTCTLRAAIQEGVAQVGAGNNVSILVLAGVYKLTLPSPAGNCTDKDSTGDLDITQYKAGTTFTIGGLDPAITIIDANQLDGVFRIDTANGAQVELVNLTIRGGRRLTGCYGFGGGVHTYSTLTNPGVVTITNCRIIDNVAAAGGGIHNEGSTLKVVSTVVANNRATPLGIKATLGGGIENIGGSLTVDASTISGNTADGGGLHSPYNGAGGGIDAFDGPVTITNSTISGNVAHTDGGGINAFGVIGIAVQLRNVTIVGNRADADADGTGSGGGIADTAANFSIQNSLIADNTDSGGEGNDCFAGPSGSLALRYVLLPSAQTCTARFTPAPVGMLSVSPAPISPLVYHGGPGRTHDLLAGSPARDAGDPSGCGFTTDERGVPRPQGTRCDLGAVEAAAPDGDGDTVPNVIDDCPAVANLDQRDSDRDGFGDRCDNCPAANNPTQAASACLTAQSKSATIDNSGGTVTGGGVTIAVPPGALGGQPNCPSDTCPTSFSTTGLSASEYQLGFASSGSGLYLSAKLQPEFITFNVPVTLTFTWPDADGFPGIVDGTFINEGTLRIFQNGVAITNTCMAQPCGVVPCCNATANTWTVQVTSFSELAVASAGACTLEPLLQPRLTLTNIKPPPADDRLVLRATMPLASGTTVTDVATKSGLGFVLGDAATGVITSATLSPGPFDASTKRGWKKKQGGSRWRYVDRTTAPPGGIRRAVVTAQGVDAQGHPLASLVVKGNGVSYAAGLTAQATVMPAAGGPPCFTARFPGAPGPQCRLNPAGTKLRCY